MSPLVRTKRPRPSDAQILRWWKRHYVDYDNPEGTPGYNLTRFSRLVRIVDKFADEVEALRRAMHDPLAPGSAETITRIGQIIGTTTGGSGKGTIQHHDCEIENYGEAINWHLRGEPEGEVDAERDRVIKLRIEDAERDCEKRSPEGLVESRDRTIQSRFRDLVNAICGEGRLHSGLHGHHPVADTPAKMRRELLSELRRELLGPNPTPAQKCKACGRVDRWPEDWPALDICSPLCAEDRSTHLRDRGADTGAEVADA